ncbi:MAG TPA: alpha/beta hydrolase [Terriglobales bacterium]|jgi:pimeloyl-ACP methyl ester carboxylesterase|nr:alpha/beta hydrolase [Terriglobales bacterium]
MPFVELKNSPHAPGVRPVRIHYRDVGSGQPVVFLHGGWGYGVYPIDRQIEALGDRVRFVIPDRSGYGRSSRLPRQMPTDFHRRAAKETLLVLDALGIERAVLWGHSDGAVIAAMIGLLAPQRCVRLILEAFHFYRNKPGSHSFFERFASHPKEVSEKVQELLVADHGAAHWRKAIQRNCRVWLKLAAQCARPDQDLYDGRLSELKVPVTFVHGRRDPRTEPGEMERVQASLPSAEMRFIEDGRHSPHSERAAWRECNGILRAIVAGK